MKKIIVLLTVCTLVFFSVLPAYADNGKVTYLGQAKQFVYEPGSENSLTDLFHSFKDVMPGDNLTQQITVKNAAYKKVKVKLYIRSLGAHEESAQFLSQLNLKVENSAKNTMPYMFDASADETAQLTDWVYLGTLYSGGEVNLDVTLSVPVELDNIFQNEIGYLDWEFKIEEYPIESHDPKPPPPETGGDSDLTLWLTLTFCLGIMLIILFIRRKKKA